MRETGLSSEDAYSAPRTEELAQRLAKVRDWDAEELDLGGLELTSVPPEVSSLKKLRTLLLNNNHLAEFPEEILNLRDLKSLDISLNHLTSVPDDISRLTQLEYLNVGRNDLRELPASVSRLQRIQQLDAYDNNILHLPNSIGACSRLKLLDLHGNSLTELPDSLADLANLTNLNVASNDIATLPATIGNLGWLHHLDASINNLAEIDVVCNLVRLHELYLLGNKVQAVPSCIANLKQLNRLSLASNEVSSIAEEIGELINLKDLYLDSNEISRLPESVGNLERLEQLFLNHNRLTKLPSGLARMGNLRVLRLEGNQIAELPNWVGRLSKLQQLHLSNNRLARLPEEICALQKLQQLHIAHNLLSALPQSITKLSGLRLLNLQGNYALRLPVEVLNPDRPADILQYYSEASTAARPLNEAKLILVGFGDVGKTCLVNRLLHDTFKKGEKETEGINITDWPIRLSPMEEVRLHVWDFGGQEIMHATHRFFLTTRSVYILVLTGRQGKEDADAEYWLSLISSVAPGGIGSLGRTESLPQATARGEGGETETEVIVVLNKINEHRFTVNQRGLAAQFPNLCIDFTETDCEDGFGIDSLRQLVIRKTNNLPHLRDDFPAAWFAIKKRLAGMKENYLGFQEFRNICVEHGEREEARQEMLASYLHNLGVVLNFRDDPRLGDDTVLNPSWVTEGVYRILNAPSLAGRKGELQLSEVADILDNIIYPVERHAFLIELMQRFELCFNVPGHSGSYLVAELLEKEQPKETVDFDAATSLRFEYHYLTIPEGLLPRFITRTYVLSEGQPRWRSGVILYFEGNRALIIGDKLRKKVQIMVDGAAPGRKRLLGVVRDNFEHIHREYNAGATEMVTVSGYAEVCVPRHKLLVLRRENVKSFVEVIGDKAVSLNVQELLNSIDLDDPAGPGEPEPGKKVRLFYSYARKDEHLRNELAARLTLFRRAGIIDEWHDRRIQPGEEWKDKIDAYLEGADVILLLVSSDFIASSYCYDVEMKRALERHANNEARVIPIIIRECSWRRTPLEPLQPLPPDGRAVATSGTNKYARDRAWCVVAENLATVFREVAEEKAQRRVADNPL